MYGGMLIVFVGGDIYGVVVLDLWDGILLWGSDLCCVSYVLLMLMKLVGRD